jgi:hypothetical protein
MDDGVSVAERAGEDTKAIWAPCESCGAKRRLSNGLCYVCMTDPNLVELVELRRSKTEMSNEIRDLQEVLDREAVDLFPIVRRLRTQVEKLQCVVDSQLDEHDKTRIEVRRLKAANQRQLSRIKNMSAELRPFRELKSVDRILPLSEAEYLLIVSILVDVVEEDQTFETFALHRKVRDLPERRPHSV